jgi:signal transduction histidine kinase
MDFYKWFIAPSSKIVGSAARSRAELASAVAVVRQMVVLGFIVWGALSGKGQHPAVMFTFITNLVFYVFSRTRFSNFAIAFLFIEVLAGIVVGAKSTGSDVSGLVMWLSLGPLMAFIILPLRLALLDVAATIVVAYFFALHPDSGSTLNSWSPIFFLSECMALGILGSYFKSRAEKALAFEQAKVLQSSKLASLGEMASGVAHELNSPLGAIVMNAELVKDVLSDKAEISRAEVMTSIDEIIKVAERMSLIISGLKSFARDSHNEPVISVATHAWIDDALNLCGQKFKSRGIQISVSGDALRNAYSFRRVQLSQVLLNLLNNSFDAISANIGAWVTVDASEKDGQLVVTVTDSGHGINKATTSRLFEPFFTTKDIGEGTGLGLSVSRGIMKSHGGSLVYDEASPNTRFLMKLPLDKFEVAPSSYSQRQAA